MTVLADPRLYLVAPLQLRAGPLAELVPELAAAGVDLIQVREKEMEAGQLLVHARPAAAACRQAGVPFIVNDRPDLALALGADGVHLGMGDLPTSVARRVLGGTIVGRSTHSRADIRAALAEEDPDYIAVGPVYETPTKPGRPAVGLDLVTFAAEDVRVPWFAIGGIDEGNLEEVLARGARRVVVVRAITESPDPASAAGRLRSLLDRQAR